MYTTPDKPLPKLIVLISVLAISTISFSQCELSSIAIQTEKRPIYSLSDIDNDDSTTFKTGEGVFMTEDEYEVYSKEQRMLSKLKSKRKFKQTFSFGIGDSKQVRKWNSTLLAYQDTSDNKISVNGNAPVISLSHDIAFDNTFSLGYTIGYQKSDITMNGKQFSTKRLFAFVHPKLIVYRNRWFEGYFQLKLGFVHHDANLSQIKSDYILRWIPSNMKFYSGVTPVGVQIKLGGRFAINAEVSLWSFESIHAGLCYNFASNPHYVQDYKRKSWKK